MRCQNVWLEKRSVSQFIAIIQLKLFLYLQWIKIYSMLSRIQYYKFISIWYLINSVSSVSARGCQICHTCTWNFVKISNFTACGAHIWSYIIYQSIYISLCFEWMLLSSHRQKTSRSLRNPSTPCSLIWLEIWRDFNFAVESIISLLAYFMVAV